MTLVFSEVRIIEVELLEMGTWDYLRDASEAVHLDLLAKYFYAKRLPSSGIHVPSFSVNFSCVYQRDKVKVK